MLATITLEPPPVRRTQEASAPSDGGGSASVAPTRRAPPRREAFTPRKAKGIDIKGQYRLTLMAGLTMSLLLMIALFRLPIRAQQEFEIVMPEQEVVQMEEIQQTEQAEPPPPPPPRPQTVVSVSDDAVLEDVELNLDASLDIGEAVEEMPPPPPPPEEEEEEEEDVEDEIFVVVEQMPELIGGLESIQQCIQYPEVARRAGLEGRVFVQFVVGPDGSVNDPQVIRGLGGGTDEEAVRCIKQAQFEPGRQRGKPVSVRYVIPVNFQLRNSSQ